MSDEMQTNKCGQLHYTKYDCLQYYYRHVRKNIYGENIMNVHNTSDDGEW